MALAPCALRGLRIAVITDLHGGAPFIDDAKIDSVVAMTNAANPDLILLAGDYSAVRRMPGGHRHTAANIAAHLKRLHASLGVIAVMGNHDRARRIPR